MQSRRASRVGATCSAASEAEGSEAAEDDDRSMGSPVVRADTLIDLVRGVDEVAQNSKASAEFACMERILAQKMTTNTTAFAARNVVSCAQAQVGEALEYGKAKVDEAVEGVKET